MVILITALVECHAQSFKGTEYVQLCIQLQDTDISLTAKFLLLLTHCV